MEDIEYVIYCRKSTDESSGKQTQSIPDQIERCLEFAEQHHLKIKLKPADFSDFESPEEIYKEDHDKYPRNREIYQKSRHLFIIKEQKSGKIPYKREKWNRLMRLIDKGTVKGLISYSPDRQARNILEGGMVINFVDEGKLDLKYTNFYFEPNAAGKMALGTWFVFSKQYSDSISENVRRGNASSAAKGKSGGIKKYGYIIDDTTGYHKPDPKNFDLMRRAFEMKIYEKKSDKDIVDRLKSIGFNKDGNIRSLSISGINAVRKDPFYYGMFKRGESITDLNEKNPFYQPMITKDEFDILAERYMDKTKVYVKTKKKEEYVVISPIPEGLLIHKESNISFTRYIPAIQRSKEKLAKLKTKFPEATLADVIQPHQIYYAAKNKEQTIHIEVRFNEIDDAMQKLLDSMRLSKKGYEEFKKYLSQEIDIVEEKKNREKQSFLRHISHLEEKRNKFILDSLPNKSHMSEKELEVYNAAVKGFDDDIKLAQENANSLYIEEREKILEFEALAELMMNAGKKYKKATYVQKEKFFEIFLSNIFVDNEKRLTFAVKPGLQGLFSSFLQPGIPGRNRTNI